ncbi:hypothetical protein GCM10009549_24360 [Streptomyces thermoalcalitolerans]|uniref:Uncharacterized protein n=1 Tax=Streptomyces thermoalcalitolerans TaxID=65605 RepID=A0ABN1NML7_9ACTN
MGDLERIRAETVAYFRAPAENATQRHYFRHADEEGSLWYFEAVPDAAIRWAAWYGGHFAAPLHPARRDDAPDYCRSCGAALGPDSGSGADRSGLRTTGTGRQDRAQVRPQRRTQPLAAE